MSVRNKKTETFNRRREGLGAVSHCAPWHVAGEWIKADGMIFNGIDGGSVSNRGRVVLGFNILPNGEADGWYLDGGYRLFDKFRSCVLATTASTEVRTIKKTERRFEILTLGIT